ncbi:EF-hand domain-containing protein [Pseudomonas marginalis]|uniref:EF-hand domain-containing protein n=1 Tax=Pseudomonas marginalis TaxID=298 RepID=UPI003BA07968
MMTPFQTYKMTRLFNFYDMDGSGKLEKADSMRRAEKRMLISGWAPDSEQAQQLQAINMQHWAMLCRYADSDGDGKISLGEWLAAHDAEIGHCKIATFDNFSPLMKTFLESILKSLDTDADGYYSVEEYAQLLKNFSNVDGAQVQELFKLMDTDKNGRFSYEEMKQAVAEYYMSNDINAPGNLIFGPLSYTG